jgi:hypothetical protein
LSTFEVRLRKRHDCRTGALLFSHLIFIHQKLLMPFPDLKPSRNFPLIAKQKLRHDVPPARKEEAPIADSLPVGQCLTTLYRAPALPKETPGETAL